MGRSLIFLAPFQWFYTHTQLKINLCYIPAPAEAAAAGDQINAFEKNSTTIGLNTSFCLMFVLFDDYRSLSWLLNNNK